MVSSPSTTKRKKRSFSSLAAGPPSSPPSSFEGRDDSNNDAQYSSKEQHQTSLFSFFSKAPKVRKVTPAAETKAKSRVYSNENQAQASSSSLLSQSPTTSSCEDESTAKMQQGDTTTAKTQTSQQTHPFFQKTSEKKQAAPAQKSKPTKSKTTKLTQVYIDCGQKQFGQVDCQKCGMLYMPGVPEDERHHKQLCKAYSKGISVVNGTVVGGKVVERSSSSNNHKTKRGHYSIVQWKPSTSSTSKCKNSPSQWPLLAQMIVKDLGMDGATALQHLSTQTVFLYLGCVGGSGKKGSSSSTKNNPNHILGAVTIQNISKAYRMSSLHSRETTPSKAMLGVGLLWTHSAARKTGIASTLVDAALQYSVFGMHIPKSMLAFSSPTKAGYDFAMKYLALKNESGGSGKAESLAPLVYEM